MRKSSQEGQNAKLRRMTQDYGLASGPANNKLAPPNANKGEGPQEAVGFGADETAGLPRARADRAGRKSAVANPVPTYAKGGAAKRAHGGRTGKKAGATHVNVIVAPQGGGAAGAPGPVAAPPMAGPPPAMPPKPPMAAGPMGPPAIPPGAAGLPMAPGAPGGLPPGIVPPRAKGGRVHLTAGAATGEGRLEKIGKHAKNAGRPQAV